MQTRPVPGPKSKSKHTQVVMLPTGLNFLNHINFSHSNKLLNYCFLHTLHRWYFRSQFHCIDSVSIFGIAWRFEWPETFTGWAPVSPTGERKEHVRNAYEEKNKIKYGHLLNATERTFSALGHTIRPFRSCAVCHRWMDGLGAGWVYIYVSSSPVQFELHIYSAGQNGLK